MKRVSAFLRIEQAGAAAPWLVLVHGATQNHKLFSAQIDAFAGTYRLLLIDLAGHGESADAAGPFGPVEYAEGVLGAINAAGIGRCHYWGTHTGTAVALLLATLEPARFASLVLEGAAIPGRSLSTVSECYERARVTTATSGIEVARKEWFDCSPWFDVMRQRPLQCRADEHIQLISQFGGAPWMDTRAPAVANLQTNQLALIGAPTLLVNGEHEVADFLPAASELEAVLPRARCLRVAEAGGFPLWEFPDQVNQAVGEFLAFAQPVL